VASYLQNVGKEIMPVVPSICPGRRQWLSVTPGDNDCFASTTGSDLDPQMYGPNPNFWTNFRIEPVPNSPDPRRVYIASDVIMSCSKI